MAGGRADPGGTASQRRALSARLGSLYGTPAYRRAVRQPPCVPAIFLAEEMAVSPAVPSGAARRASVGSRLQGLLAAGLGATSTRRRLDDTKPRFHRVLPLGVPPARRRPARRPVAR